MKPLKGKIIVKAFLEQKESHEVKCDDGRVLQLYIGRKYAENNREANPTVCEVVAVSDGYSDNVDCVSIGDTLIVNHNLIGNKASWIEEKDGYVTLTINADSSIYAKLCENGTLQPVFGNLIAERIHCKDDGRIEAVLVDNEVVDDGGIMNVIVAPFSKTHDYVFKVLAISEGEQFASVGDYVVCYKHSDYEMVYNYGGSEKRAIRIKGDDVLGKVNL